PCPRNRRALVPSWCGHWTRQQPRRRPESGEPGPPVHDAVCGIDPIGPFGSGEVEPWPRGLKRYRDVADVSIAALGRRAPYPEAAIAGTCHCGLPLDFHVEDRDTGGALGDKTADRFVVCRPAHHGAAARDR